MSDTGDYTEDPTEQLAQLYPTYDNWKFMIQMLLNVERQEGRRLYKGPYTFKNVHSIAENFNMGNGKLYSSEIYAEAVRDQNDISRKKYNAYIKAFKKYYTVSRIQNYIMRKKAYFEDMYAHPELYGAELYDN